MKRVIALVMVSMLSLSAQSDITGDYRINSGDILEIFVWNEEALTREVRVRPDGFISLPLAGEFQASGRTPVELGKNIAESLSEYLNDSPVVTVSALAMEGNLVYVLGKVNRPGVFPVASRVDVTQALALAGGLSAFADENVIRVLRRGLDGQQEAIRFNYTDIKKGKDLSSNMVLQSGDVVIVP